MSSPNQDPTSDTDSEFEIVQDFRAKFKQAREEVRDLKEQLEDGKKNFEVYQDNYKLMEANFKESLAAQQEKFEEEKKRADKLAEELEELKELAEKRSGEVGQLESSALEVKNLKDQLAAQDESRRLLSEEMAELLQHKKDAEVKLQASQAECADLRSEAETLRNEVLLKHSETEAYKQEIEAYKVQLEAVQGEAAKRDEKKFGDLFDKSMEDESIRALLESENAVLQTDLEELKASSTKQIMERDDMVQALLTENENLKVENRQLLQESESNRMLADECTANNIQLAEERDRTNQSFALAEQEKTRLEGRIAQMQEQSQLAAQNRSPQATPANAHPGPTPAPADGPAPADAPADGPAPAAAGN